MIGQSAGGKRRPTILENGTVNLLNWDGELYKPTENCCWPGEAVSQITRSLLSQYCAHDYQKLVKQFGMQPSMSRRGNCYDNAPMESFWGSLKNELVHHQRYATRADAQAAIQEYIESFYNRQRRHSRLGNVPPALFAEKFSKQPQAV